MRHAAGNTSVSLPMIFSWNEMSLADFAAFQRLMGLRVVKVGDVYWTELRPGFYRPMVTWEAYAPGSIAAPFSALIGGAQYAVRPGDPSNSTLNMFIFDELRGYTRNSLSKNPRRLVRLAEESFTIRQITSVDEFKRQAFQVYLSFYSRTQYRISSERHDPQYFSAWADALFKFPRLLILGGYRNGELGGIGVSLLTGDTVYYASVFCDDQSLKLYLYDLFLHALRESAAVDPKIRQIFFGMHKNNPGLDDFKRFRGAKLLRQAAHLRINPVTKMVLKKFMARRYSQLLGCIGDEAGLPTGT
jgi:hypothetical protein